jgi:hypothetical protein
MRDELWADWVASQKTGPNPDAIPSEDLDSAYLTMLERQRSNGPKER